MSMKPEETKKPTHGPKPEKGLGAFKKPGAVKPGEQNPETDKFTPVITHKYEQNTHPERDCTLCGYAIQTGENEWECSREHYFPRTLICFVPKKTVEEA